MVELPWVFLGLLAALIIVSIIMGVVASKKVERYEDEISEEKNSSARTDSLVDLTEKHKRFRYMRTASLPLVVVFTLIIALLVLSETMFAVTTSFESFNSMLNEFLED